MEIEVSKQQYENAKAIIDYFISNSNLYKYNYSGLFYGILNKEACYNNRFLCCEFVYYILEKINIVDFEIPRNLVRPESLLNINGNIVYRGDLKQYKYTSNNYDLKEMNLKGLSAI